MSTSTEKMDSEGVECGAEVNDVALTQTDNSETNSGDGRLQVGAPEPITEEGRLSDSRSKAQSTSPDSKVSGSGPILNYGKIGARERKLKSPGLSLSREGEEGSIPLRGAPRSNLWGKVRGKIPLDKEKQKEKEKDDSMACLMEHVDDETEEGQTQDPNAAVEAAGKFIGFLVQEASFRKATIDPESTQYRTIQTTVTVVAVLNIFLITYKIGFPSPFSWNYYLFDLVSFFIILLGCLIEFRTWVVDSDGDLQKNPDKIRMFYMSKGYFVYDFVALLPLAQLYFIFSCVIPLLGWDDDYFYLLQIVRLCCFPKIYSFLKRSIVSATMRAGPLGRLLIIVFFVILMTHLFACFWFFIGKVEGFGVDDWVPTKDLAEASKGATFQYLFAFYYSFVTMTGVGFSLEPETSLEVIASLLFAVVGISVYATLVGQVGAILSNLDASEQAYEEKVEAVSMYMNYRNIPLNMRDKIYKYYEYLWQRQRCMRDEDVIGDLPTAMKTEILSKLYSKYLRKIPLFSDCEDSVIRAFCTQLQPIVCPSDQYIIFQGDLGKEMYILCRGSVTIEVNGNVVGALGPGSFFGEMSLLTSQKRTASIKSTCFCDLLELTKEDFDLIMEDFPDVKTKMQGVVTRRKKSLSTTVDKMERRKSFSAVPAGPSDSLSPSHSPRPLNARMRTASISLAPKS